MIAGESETLLANEPNFNRCRLARGGVDNRLDDRITPLAYADRDTQNP